MKKQIIVLCSVWLLLVLFHFAEPDRVFSEAENRYLQQAPTGTRQSILNGTWEAETEKYLSDQLPFRDMLVQLHAAVKKTAGSRDNQNVYLEKDGRLQETFWEYDEEICRKNLETAAAFADEAKKRETDVKIMLVPTAAAVQSQYLPRYAPELDQSAILDRAEKAYPGLSFVRTEGVLRDHAEEYIYYRTDHHWTSLGAFYACTEYLSETGGKVPELNDYREELLGSTFYGSSYAGAGQYHTAPDEIHAMLPAEMPELTVDYGNGLTETTLYDRNFLKKRDQYRVFLKGNYPLTILRTDSPGEKKLLLVKDSFANTFVQFLLKDYAEIHMVDPRYYQASLKSYLKEQEFTDVLFLYQLKNFTKERIWIK